MYRLVDKVSAALSVQTERVSVLHTLTSRTEGYSK